MYRINSILVLLGMLLASLLGGCRIDTRHNNEDSLDINYQVEDFKSIKLQGAYDVHLSQNNTSGISMNTSEGLHDRIKIYVEDETLYVVTRGKQISTKEVDLKISIHELKNIKIEGGAYLTTDGFIEVDEIDINVEGGAHIDMKLHANVIKARAEGGVNMQFKGVSKKFEVHSEGAGNIDADQLKSELVICSVTGIGNASVYATNKLEASVEGLGKISYRGDPEVIKSVNGIGAIYRK